MSFRSRHRPVAKNVGPGLSRTCFRAASRTHNSRSVAVFRAALVDACVTVVFVLVASAVLR
eukprot:14603946-Alexandrium_andersonii.AAC.1